MELKLGNKYTKEYLEEYQKKHVHNHSFRFGFSHEHVLFIRFGTYEFWNYKENEENQYTCVRTPEGYFENNAPKQITAFHDKSRRKTAAYYTRDTQATRDAKKWGYRPQG